MAVFRKGDEAAGTRMHVVMRVVFCVSRLSRCEVCTPLSFSFLFVWSPSYSPLLSTREEWKMDTEEKDTTHVLRL